MASTQLNRPETAETRRWLSTVGVTIRYLIAVPFLALGAALMTIGALIAGSSPPPRHTVGRAQRGPNGESC